MHVGHLLPLAAKAFRDFGVVDVGFGFDNLLPLIMGEDHEGVHRPLDVVGIMASLKKKNIIRFFLSFDYKLQISFIFKILFLQLIQ